MFNHVRGMGCLAIGMMFFIGQGCLGGEVPAKGNTLASLDLSGYPFSFGDKNSSSSSSGDDMTRQVLKALPQERQMRKTKAPGGTGESTPILFVGPGIGGKIYPENISKALTGPTATTTSQTVTNATIPSENIPLEQIQLHKIKQADSPLTKEDQELLTKQELTLTQKGRNLSRVADKLDELNNFTPPQLTAETLAKKQNETPASSQWTWRTYLKGAAGVTGLVVLIVCLLRYSDFDISSLYAAKS